MQPIPRSKPGVPAQVILPGGWFATTTDEALKVAGNLATALNGPRPILHKIPSGAYKTDKVQQGYLPVYERIAQLIGSAAHVCELGVWHGGSMATWMSMFPDGIVAGVDIDPDSCWPDGSVKIVSRQDDEALPARLREASPDGYDLIIDDASHDGMLTRKSWELLWPLVKPDGWYIVEDWFVGLGLPQWRSFGSTMLTTAESFLPLLMSQESDPDSIEYRYGMIIMHRRKD